MNVEDKKTFIAENYPDCMIANGFGDAILGIVERHGHEAVVLYDKNKCIEILMEEHEISTTTATLYRLLAIEAQLMQEKKGTPEIANVVISIA